MTPLNVVPVAHQDSFEEDDYGEEEQVKVVVVEILDVDDVIESCVHICVAGKQYRSVDVEVLNEEVGDKVKEKQQLETSVVVQYRRMMLLTATDKVV